MRLSRPSDALHQRPRVGHRLLHHGGLVRDDEKIVAQMVVAEVLQTVNGMTLYPPNPPVHQLSPALQGIRPIGTFASGLGPS